MAMDDTLYAKATILRERKVNSILVKTFGGLSKRYYFRQLFFALLIAALSLWGRFQTAGMTLENMGFLTWIAGSTFLYPYSRFVYESVVNFIVGDNLFIVDAMLSFAAKIVTMAMCFFLAIFIAPIGLLYLYWHHSK